MLSSRSESDQLGFFSGKFLDCINEYLWEFNQPFNSMNQLSLSTASDSMPLSSINSFLISHHGCLSSLSIDEQTVLKLSDGMPQSEKIPLRSERWLT